MADPMVSGILLAFDSPGGEVKGLFDLADSMSAEPRNKPMLAFVDQACSAAFMLASTADQIVISQVGEIGSVGVIALHRDVSARDEQDGLKYTAIYAGARKNDGNPHEPLTPGAKSEIQSRIDQIYEMFATAVAQNRGMSAAAVRKTEAAIFLGESGVEIGLADAVGSMDDAVGMLASAIQKGERSLFASSAGAPANSTKEKHMEATSGAPAETKQPTAAEIEALVKQARDAGFAEASGIADLCAIAGTPARAAEFIGQRKSVDQVRKELLAARVEAEAGKELNSGVMPGAADAAAAAASGPVQGKAKPWREVLKGLGARLKGEV
jgi:signal peptide peptidase SppA